MIRAFLQRHFSLMLALRYLNPLRTYFSIITLICLTGVALGIMVLIVVLSVMGGLQQEIKGRFLAYAPHITVNYSPYPGVMAPMPNWREVLDKIQKTQGVESAYPQIEDYVLIDANGAQKPSLFRAVDTENATQMAEMRALLAQDSEGKPQGSFDLGMGEEAVISSSLAQNMDLQVGSILRVYAKRNYEDVVKSYELAGKALKIEEEKALNVLAGLWKNCPKEGPLWALSENNYLLWQGLLDKWQQSPTLRASEAEILKELASLLSQGEKSKLSSSYLFSSQTPSLYTPLIQKLQSLDIDQEDLASFKNIKDLVLPRDLEVIGIYQSSRHMSSPEIFVPLTIGQELLGLEDTAQGIAVRATEPYNLAPTEAHVAQSLPKLPQEVESWTVRNWMHNPSIATWVSLMQQERVMISFVLFFITLVSAFCIMAVMFAMAIQRKREIAVMKALGATPKQIIFVFLWQGLIIGLLGALSGWGLGMLVVYYRTQIREMLVYLNFDPFPVNFHGVALPALVDPQEILLVCSLSFLMVVLASIIPALMSSRQDPAKSLRSL